MKSPVPLSLLLGLGISLAALWPAMLSAHGDGHAQIQELTDQLQKEPANVDLYVRRGELHRVHQLWDEAQADYERALTLNPRLEGIDFLRGRLWFEGGWPLSARAALDRFLKTHTNHVEGFVIRARVHHKLGLELLAAQDYTKALSISPDMRPELYIERAQVLTAAGSNHWAEAMQGIDDGIKRLGPLVTLQLQGIELELKQGRPDAALARVDTLAAQSPRKETWLKRRGEILKQAGRENEAHEAFQAALAALDKLPPARRNVPAMIELEKQLRAALAPGPLAPVGK